MRYNLATSGTNCPFTSNVECSSCNIDSVRPERATDLIKSHHFLQNFFQQASTVLTLSSRNVYTFGCHPSLCRIALNLLVIKLSQQSLLYEYIQTEYPPGGTVFMCCGTDRLYNFLLSRWYYSLAEWRGSFMAASINTMRSRTHLSFASVLVQILFTGVVSLATIVQLEVATLSSTSHICWPSPYNYSIIFSSVRSSCTSCGCSGCAK